MPSTKFFRPHVWFVPLALLPLIILLACGGGSDSRESEDSKGEFGQIWEVWQLIDESYANRADLETEAVVGSALRTMLDLAGEPPYPFLTEVGRIRGQVPPGVPVVLADVWRGLVLHQSQWPDVDQNDLVEAAISGIVNGLGQPGVTYLNPNAYPEARESLEEDLEGTYVGIGARVVVQDEGILLFPFRDSPAEKAEIEAGDVLLAVQGEPVAGKSIEEVVEVVAGPEGTKVRLRIQRSGQAEPLDVDVFRGTIDLTSVTSRLVPGGIGYIRIGLFRDNTGEQVFDALEDLKRFDMLALILDLRSNPGGSEQAAADVAGQFLPPGSLFLNKEDRHGRQQELYVGQDLERLQLGELPMVVLVNQATVGEAEAVAAALQEIDRVVVMGAETAGKVGTYNFLELSNGSAIYMPTLRWFTASGREMSNTGIVPDLPVAFQREDEGFGGEAQFNRAYEYLDKLLPPFR